MNRSLLLWALLVAFWDVNAQVPGYLGKRFTVEGNVVVGLTTLKIANKHLDIDKYLQDYGETSDIVAVINGQIGYTIGRRFTLAASVARYRKPTKIDKTEDIFFERILVSGVYDVNVLSIGVNGRFYFMDATGLAPIGSYLGFGIVRNQFNGQLAWYYNSFNKGSYKEFNGTPPSYLPANMETFNWSIPLELGRNQILFGQWYLNYGIRASIPWFWNANKANLRIDENDNFFNEKSQFTEATFAGNKYRWFYTVYIGTGLTF